MTKIVSCLYFYKSDIEKKEECMRKLWTASGRNKLSVIFSVFSYIKKLRHHLWCDKGPYREIYDFSGSHVWIEELDHKGQVSKNGCF